MKLLAFVAVAATAIVIAAPSYAGEQARWSSMSLSQRHDFVSRNVQHYRSTVRWWLNHRTSLSRKNLFHPVRLCAIGIRAPGPICDAGWRLQRAVKTLNAIDDQIAAARQPAHLALWRCIERGESGGDGVNPGSTYASNGSHFNVLQMTNPWMGINPIGQTYQFIETYAERQYAASGYSSDWLSNQWGQTIGPCWRYAE